MEQVREAPARPAAPDAGPARPRPWVTRRQTRSTSDVVDRGLVTLALVWQALWIVGDQRLWPTSLEGLWAPALAWASILTWLALALAQVFDVRRLSWPLRTANVGVLVALSTVVLVNAAQAPEPDWSAASSLAVLPVAMAGLLFPFVIAAAWLTATVAIEAIVVFGVFDPSVAATVQAQDVLFPAYALSVGVVTLAARRALVRDGRAVDLAAEDLVNVEQARLVADSVEASVRREERLLHATVLNTLTALVRGGLTTSELRARLNERCREAAHVMRQLRLRVEPRSTHSEGQWLDRDLAESIVDLYSEGVAVNIDCPSLGDVPADVYDAIVVAAREALANVSRHADARSVWIEAKVTSDHSGRWARVVVRDDGRGFDRTQAPDRFGVRSAMEQSLADVGGALRVTSQPGEGTAVVIEWSTQASGGGIPPFRPAARAFAIPILVSFGLFNALVLVLTRDDVANMPEALFAFGIFVVLAVLVARSSLSGEVPWWVVLVVAGASPLIYQLQTQSVVGPHGTWTDWSSGAIVALFVVAAGAGPTWSWLVLVAMWVCIQGDVIHELIAAGTALIIAAALFGRSTRRNAAAVEAARIQTAVEEAAVAVSSASVRRMASRYGALRESRVTALLDGIVGGRIDPDDDLTRYHAALEERFIRTVVKVDPAAGAVHALATSLAIRALRRGIFLDVDIAGDAPPGAAESAPARESLLVAIDWSEPGGVARFSARDESGTYAIRLISPIATARRADALHLPVPGAVVDPDEPDMLWELHIEDGGRM